LLKNNLVKDLLKCNKSPIKLNKGFLGSIFHFLASGCPSTQLLLIAAPGGKIENSQPN
jgi:hypothetical protein